MKKIKRRNWFPWSLLLNWLDNRWSAFRSPDSLMKNSFFLYFWKGGCRSALKHKYSQPQTRKNFLLKRFFFFVFFFVLDWNQTGSETLEPKRRLRCFFYENETSCVLNLQLACALQTAFWSEKQRTVCFMICVTNVQVEVDEKCNSNSWNAAQIFPPNICG